MSVYVEQIVPSVVSAIANHGHDNVLLVCGDGGQVRTSALLLAFLSPWLGEMLKDSQEDAELCLILPHTQADRVRVVLESLLGTDGLVDKAEIQEMFNSGCSDVLKPSENIKHNFSGNKNSSVWTRKDISLPLEVEISDQDNVKHELMDEDELEEKEGQFNSVLNRGKGSNTWKEQIKLKRLQKPKNVTITPGIKLCPHCAEAFSNKSEGAYNHHVMMHECCNCEPSWETNREKNFHMKCVHMGQFGCEPCIRTFESETVFKLHMELTHSEVNEYDVIKDILTPHKRGDVSAQNDIEVGETFAAKEEVKSRIQLFSDSNFSPLVIQSSGVRNNSFLRISYKCPYGVMKKSQSKGIRQKAHQYVGCPVTLNINQQTNGAFVVSKAVLEHKEHDIGEEWYAKFRKKLSKDQEEAVRAFLETKPSNREVSIFLNDLTGKQYSTLFVREHIVRKLKSEK